MARETIDDQLSTMTSNKQVNEAMATMRENQDDQAKTNRRENE